MMRAPVLEPDATSVVINDIRQSARPRLRGGNWEYRALPMPKNTEVVGVDGFIMAIGLAYRKDGNPPADCQTFLLIVKL